MIDLIVFRGLGEREGQEIFEPLLSDVAPAVQRGKYEIDFATPKTVFRVEVAYAPTLRLGDEAVLHDPFTGDVTFCVVREFSHVREGVTLFTNISVEAAQ